VIEIAPDNPIGYENIGSVYMRQGKWSEAIPRYQKALSIDPDSPTYSNLGTAYFFLKRYDEAVKMYEKAVQGTTGDEYLWSNLADAYRWLGQSEKAQAAYKRAIVVAKMGSDAQSAGSLGDLALLLRQNRGSNASSAKYSASACEISGGLADHIQ